MADAVTPGGWSRRSLNSRKSACTESCTGKRSVGTRTTHSHVPVEIAIGKLSPVGCCWEILLQISAALLALHYVYQAGLLFCFLLFSRVLKPYHVATIG